MPGWWHPVWNELECFHQHDGQYAHGRCTSQPTSRGSGYGLVRSSTIEYGRDAIAIWRYDELRDDGQIIRAGCSDAKTKSFPASDTTSHAIKPSTNGPQLTLGCWRYIRLANQLFLVSNELTIHGSSTAMDEPGYDDEPTFGVSTAPRAIKTLRGQIRGVQAQRTRGQPNHLSLFQYGWSPPKFDKPKAQKLRIPKILKQTQRWGPKNWRRTTGWGCLKNDRIWGERVAEDGEGDY